MVLTHLEYAIISLYFAMMRLVALETRCSQAQGEQDVYGKL